MNKQEYLQLIVWSRRGDRIVILSSMLLMFIGIPLAAVTPPPWNAVALMGPYVAAISLIVFNPVKYLIDWNDVRDFTRRVIDSYTGDKTAYLEWHRRKFKNWPLDKFVRHSRYLAAQQVLRKAVDAYQE